ncbi:MAG: type III-B CRISPR module RAMP protein Cmr4, partial [Calditerricola sp.]|nr:type III-B CRISPR module RAMP protein Cmr4 [Calditerricola sp.]
ALKVSPHSLTQQWAEWFRDHVMPDDYRKQAIGERLVVVDNDTFRDFVTFQTEVVTRVRIDNEKGTVKNGGLFTEEYLPTESVLYSLVLAAPPFVANSALSDAASVMNAFVAHLPEVFQLGGNATLGKGLVRTRILWQHA